MQHSDKHIFLDPALNADDAPHLIGPQEWVNMKNFRIGSTPNVSGGARGFLESIGSTILRTNSNLPLLGTNFEIGYAVDEPFLRIIYFVWNSLGSNGIYCYDLPSQTVYTILKDIQLVGGLNFDKYHLIHSAFVLNGCVYWTDHFNEPRRININAGIKMNHPSYVTSQLPYTAPLDQSVIKWIRRQPGLPPTQTKFDQTSPTITTNFIQNEAFQFCVRYVYRDFETGTLSALSQLANFNSSGDQFNRIDVALQLQEKIQQDVVQVDLVARYLISGIYFIINSWLTTNAADEAAIIAHNNGTQALTFSFYNDKLGIALDTAYSIKPFDSVPVLTESVADAKNRAIMSGNTLGYDSPSTTSLSATLVSQGTGGTVVGTWTFFSFTAKCNPVITNSRSIYMLQVENLANPYIQGYYRYIPSTLIPPFPATVNWTDIEFMGGGLFEVMNFFYPGCANHIVTWTPNLATSTILGAPPPAGLVGAAAFKSDAARKLAITFYDNEGRKCGVVSNNTLQLSVPDRTFNSVAFYTKIAWLLDNTNALTEIPPWAYYYSIDISLCLRTRFFLQARAPGIKYATKDADGNWVVTSTTYSPTNAGVAVDISYLYSQGMGYTFAQGDILKLYDVSGTVTSMSIIAQFSNFVICQLAPVTIGPANSTMFEIYTPYQPQVNEPEYEVGQIFPVTAPTTSGRMYSIISGNITGDITMLSRNDGTSDYPTENMSPNDKYYLDWFTDAGRPNFIDTIGQTTQGSSLSFSNTFINGAKINGLSTFDALDTYDLSPDYGTILKIILTNKVQRTGSVLLAIGNAGETSALYLNENVVTTTVGETTLAQTTNFIGYSNNLRGSYGTLNPESVIVYKGNVYWFDALNGKFIQYSDSGLFPISNYKMTRFWKLFSDQFNSMTPQQIEAFGGRPFIFTGIDPHNGELMASVPQVLAEPPEGVFADYTPNIPYPFDIYDGQGKSVVFKIIADPNKWVGSYDIKAEGFAYMQDKAFAFSGGNIYELNDTASFCNIFGTQYIPQVMILGNGISVNEEKRPKKLNGISVQANFAPSFTLFRVLYPTEQGSDLAASDYSNLNGIFYARIKRDRLTLGFPDYYAAIYGGNKLTSTVFYTMLQFDATQGLVQIKYVDIKYTLAIGHAAV